MQGLKVLATIVDEITKVDAKFVSHWRVKYRSKVTESRCMLSEDVC